MHPATSYRANCFVHSVNLYRTKQRNLIISTKAAVAKFTVDSRRTTDERGGRTGTEHM